MFNKHLIMEADNGKALYLFIDFDYEFSFDFNLKSKKEKIQDIYEKVIDYIKDKNIDFKTGKVFLVVGGLVISSLLIQNYKYSDLKEQFDPNYQYVENVNIFDDSATKNNIFTPTTSNANTPTNETKVITQEPVTSTSNATSSTPIVETKKKTTTASPPVINTTPPTSNTTFSTTNAVTPASPTTPAQQPVTSPSPPPAPAVTEQMVTLYRYNGTVDQISLEDYVVGVVSSEMPASFNTEALKAQSVLARTYALKKMSQNQVLKDDTSNQVYKDSGQLKTMWGSSFDTYYNKIKNAVASTKGQYITYNGTYIEAVYHSTSNGKTEDSVAVWGNSYPYLKSVDSHWDLDASSYLREIQKEFSVLSSIIGINFNAQTNIEVLSRTTGDRIDQIKIDDTLFTGIELRTLLGLRSADFDIRIENGTVVFVTRGYGHGVGMSQYGANGMAKEGYNYKDILTHYYSGTQIKS